MLPKRQNWETSIFREVFLSFCVKPKIRSTRGRNLAQIKGAADLGCQYISILAYCTIHHGPTIAFVYITFLQLSLPLFPLNTTLTANMCIAVFSGTIHRPTKLVSSPTVPQPLPDTISISVFKPNQIITRKIFTIKMYPATWTGLSKYVGNQAWISLAHIVFLFIDRSVSPPC